MKLDLDLFNLVSLEEEQVSKVDGGVVWFVAAAAAYLIAAVSSVDPSPRAPKSLTFRRTA